LASLFGTVGGKSQWPITLANNIAHANWQSWARIITDFYKNRLSETQPAGLLAVSGARVNPSLINL